MTKTIPLTAADFETGLNAQVTAGDTTATLISIVDTDGNNLANGLYGFTVDGDVPESKEYIVATLTGSALSGVISITDQGVTAASAFQKFHRRGANVAITDWVVLSRVVNALTGVTGLDGGVPLAYDSAPALGSSNQLATVQYVLDHINGGAVSFNAELIAGMAGETVASGDWVYLKLSDGRWYKTDADFSASCINVTIGKTRGAGTAGNAISGGVFVNGLETIGTYTPNQAYYISNTSGALATSPGTIPAYVGTADANGKLVFNIPVTPAILKAPGEVTMYAGSVAPAGSLLCDGTAYSRTIYAALFAAIGTTFGTGDGSTTFNVPDLRGRMAIGVGTGTKVATFASRSSNVITVTGITNTANNEFQTGEVVLYHTAGSVITGLTNDTNYYLVRTGNLTFSLATTLANAQNGVVISLSSDGSGVQTFTLTRAARTRGDTGGEENHAMSNTEILAHVHTALVASGAASNVGGSFLTTVAGNTGSVGGNAAMNVMSPFLALNFIIKF